VEGHDSHISRSAYGRLRGPENRTLS
jgi:hypothetical protein